MRPAYHGRTHSPDGTDPIPGIGDGNGAPMVWGAIYNDGGTIEAGSGDWTVVVTGVALNVYTITFASAFASPPIVLATPNNNNAAGGVVGGYFAELVTRATGSIVIKTWELDGTPADGGFDFLAIGPM